jgi:hypothetical protein
MHIIIEDLAGELVIKSHVHIGFCGISMDIQQVHLGGRGIQCLRYHHFHDLAEFFLMAGVVKMADTIKGLAKSFIDADADDKRFQNNTLAL